MLKYSLKVLSLLSLVLVIAISPIATLAQGTVLADTGFRPQTNGFAFANYGNTINKEDGTSAPVVNLTPAAMQKVFGDRVCKAITDGQCVLTATAQAWLDNTNKSMDGGHCEGMAALSKLIFTGQVKLADLDPNATSIRDLKPDNPRVQEEIARWWATQSVPPTATQEIKQPPNQIVDTLIQNLKANTGPFTMGIYKPDGSGGHAITPYSVVDMGNGIVRVLVYDNNYPNEERFIEVDRNNNTWKYTGSTNPNEPPAEYSGDANTLGLTLTPATARTTQPQECSFCKPDDGGIGAAPTPDPNAAAGGEVTETTTQEAPETADANRAGSGGCGSNISAGPESDLLVTDENGNSSGVVNGQPVSDIPGSTVVRPRSQDGDLSDDTPGANVILPTGDGVNVTSNSDNLFMASCGGFQNVARSSRGSSPYTLGLGENAGDIILDLDDEELLDLLISGGYDNPDGNDFIYSLLVDAANGGIINIDVDPETGDFNISSDSDISVTPTFANITPEGEYVENTYDPIEIAANENLSVNGDDAAYNEAPEFVKGAANTENFTKFEEQKQLNLSLFDAAGADDSADSESDAPVIRWFYDADGNYVEVLSDGTVVVTDPDGNATSYGPGELVDENGEPLYSEEELAPSGDAGSGDAGSGDTGSGDAGSGDAGSGDAGSGDTGSGDAGSGDTGSGDAGSGDAGGGDDYGGDDYGGDDGGSDG